MPLMHEHVFIDLARVAGDKSQKLFEVPRRDLSSMSGILADSAYRLLLP
ncbi:hypothetical protein [Streptomyces sp. NPDC017993]